MQYFLLIVFLIFVGQTLGALLGLLRKPTQSALQYLLAFAAAMMVGISLFELIPEALEVTSVYVLAAGLLSGLLAIIAVDGALPHINPELGKKEKPTVKRSVAMLVIGIALHNLPEGLAIGIGFALSPALGLLIALGIAIQDVPENIATIVPLYALTGKRMRSFAVLVTTVLFEAAGFVIGFFFLQGMPQAILGAALGAAAGVMLYISFEELLPYSQPKEKPYKKLAVLIVGFLVVIAMGFFF